MNKYKQVDGWEAVAYAAAGHDVKKIDPTLHCDYACLRRGYCRYNCGEYLVELKLESK